MHGKKFIIAQVIKNIYSTPFDSIAYFIYKYIYMSHYITWPLKREKGKLVDIALDSLSLFFLSKYLLLLLSTSKGLAFMFHMFLYSKAKEKCACTQINTHSCI